MRNTQPAGARPINNTYLLLPVAGILLFIILYGVAAALYPGGSYSNPTGKGFSWTHNYWCNLLNNPAINGQYNTAQPVAVGALLLLCVTLGWFWWWLPPALGLNRNMTVAIRLSGVLSMGTAFLLFTPLHHDAVINIASGFGLIAMAGTFAGLYKAGWYGLFAWGCFNLLLVGLNNFVYYNKGLTGWLPLVQKLTFIAFLAWFCCISVYLFRRRTKLDIGQAGH